MKVLSKNKKPDNQIIELQQKNEEYLSGWKRCLADFENYKRNQDDWMKKFREGALEGVFSDLIPVLNNFSLAISHIPENEGNKPLRDGVIQIEKQLKEVLLSRGLNPIEVKEGDLFDPNIHESLGEKMAETNQNLKEEKMVVRVDEIVSLGYKLGDKVLSPAKVRVKMDVSNDKQ